MRITDVSVVAQRRRRADVHRALVLSVTVQAIGMWAMALLFPQRADQQRARVATTRDSCQTD
jgi:hypothetical protein